jgi:hypothetical protein
LSSHSFASGGGSRFTVMFGQTRAYSALMPSHFSSPASVSGLIASTGHSGSQTPQSMHSSGSCLIPRFDLGLVVQNYIQQGIMDFQFSVVFDEAQFAEFVHEKAYA